MKKVRSIFFVSGISMLLALTSCNSDTKHPGYEYMPDMYRSPSYETYSPNPNFKDGMSARTPVAGTVPVGFKPFPFANTKEGYEAAGNDWKVGNEMRTEANMREGKRLYEIYCMHCHGATGNGDGSVVTAGGYPPPPSYSKGNSSRGGKLSELSDGKIYHTITYGLNMMGPHASQLDPQERSKIVMYVRELQKGDGSAKADTTGAGVQESNIAAPGANAKTANTKQASEANADEKKNDKKEERREKRESKKADKK